MVQTPLLLTVPAPQVIVGGVLVFWFRFVPLQLLLLPQPIAQLAAAAKAIADTRKIFIRPPLYSAVMRIV
jgi:hypothetical protein